MSNYNGDDDFKVIFFVKKLTPQSYTSTREESSIWPLL